MVDVRARSNPSGADTGNDLYGTCSRLLSTWFWCGNSPCAPGTVGSIAALPLVFFVHYNYLVGIAIFMALLVIGSFAVRNYVAHRPGACDPSEVVVDEVCGQLLTLMIPIILERCGLIQLFPDGSSHNMLLFLGSGVISFRLMDIVKPWPICFVDQNVKGALGIMLDDLLAAIPASVLMLAIMNLKLI